MSARHNLNYPTYNILEEHIFEHPDYTMDATDRLLAIQQGELSVAQYSVEFWTLAKEAGWNKPMGVF